MPDGMTVDAEGGVWICHWEGWRVSRFLPNGKIDLEIKLPVPLVTSCAFAGDALDTLYITTATVGLDAAALAKAPLAGSLFTVKTGHKGLAGARLRRRLTLAFCLSYQAQSVRWRDGQHHSSRATAG